MAIIKGTETVVNPLQESGLNKKGLCDYVINVASGCLHGCSFCLEPSTLILYADMIWRPVGDVKVGDMLLGFDENPTTDVYRCLRPTIVEGVLWNKQFGTRMITEHSEVVTTANHGWLNKRGNWVSTNQLVPNSSGIKYIGEPQTFSVTEEYKIGYIAGMTLGDGTYRYDPNVKYYGDYTPYWRVVLCDEEPLGRLVMYLASFGIEVYIRPFYKGSEGHRPSQKVEIRSLNLIPRLHHILTKEITSLEYMRGFIAGFFDAEGSYNGSLRIAQKDISVLERVSQYGFKLGFKFALESYSNCAASTLHLLGGFREVIRFFATIQPAIARKSSYLYGMAIKGIDKEQVIHKEFVGEIDVIDIQTSTHTFFANGLATHNCYVPSTPVIRTRQSQFIEKGVNDPQLEWGKYLFIREEIPERLEKILSGKKEEFWHNTGAGRGVVLLCSGTDPYQNKQTASITRQVVKILLQYKKRVRILTRSPLWIEDLDILNCPNVTVGMSLPYLNDELSRQIEPHAPLPSLRYKALLEGRKAGCRLYVAVAPTPPHMTGDDFKVHLEKIMHINPEVIFWEPINARGSNGKRMLAAGLDFAESVMTKSSWAQCFIQQWLDIETAASLLGCLDKLHIWVDPNLKGYVDDEKLSSWLYKPTVEKWNNSETGASQFLFSEQRLIH